MKDSIVFVGNCQMEALKRLFDRFIRPHSGGQVTCIASYDELSEDGCERLRRADVIVEQVLDLSPKLQLDHLSLKSDRVRVPMVSAAFLWPFAGEAHPLNEPSWFSRHGPYAAELGDSYLNRLIMQRTDPEEAVARYLDLDINKMRNLDRLMELSLDRQRRRDDISDFRIADVIEDNFRTERVSLSPNHPDVRLMMVLATQLFARLDARQECISDMTKSTRISPCPLDELPVHPSVARHFRLGWHSSETRYRIRPDGYFTAEEHWLRYVKYEWNRDLREGIVLAARDPNAAMPLLQAGLRKSPQSADGHCAIADILLRAGDLDGALASCETANALEPDIPDAHHRLANILFRSGHDNEALSHAEAATSMDPANHHSLALRARILLRLGDLGSAERYARLATSAVDDPHSWALLGDILTAQARLEEALACFEHAARLAPGQSGFLARCRRLLERLGRTGEVP